MPKKMQKFYFSTIGCLSLTSFLYFLNILKINMGKLDNFRDFVQNNIDFDVKILSKCEKIELLWKKKGQT